MSDNDWVKIFEGPLVETQILRSKLEDSEIPAFIPDETIQVIDPFVRGGAVFSVSLHVPAESAEEALALIQKTDLSKEEAPRAGGGDGLPEETEEDATELARRKLGKVAQRIGFASVLLFTGPIALYLALFDYFPVVRKLGLRPANHTLVLLSLPLAVLSSLVILWALVAQLILA